MLHIAVRHISSGPWTQSHCRQHDGRVTPVSVSVHKNDVLISAFGEVDEVKTISKVRSSIIENSGIRSYKIPSFVCRISYYSFIFVFGFPFYWLPNETRRK